MTKRKSDRGWDVERCCQCSLGSHLLHRLHPKKREVLVYDYVDDTVPALRRMSGKRIRGYESFGYTVETPGTLTHTGT